MASQNDLDIIQEMLAQVVLDLNGFRYGMHVDSLGTGPIDGFDQRRHGHHIVQIREEIVHIFIADLQGTGKMRIIVLLAAGEKAHDIADQLVQGAGIACRRCRGLTMKRIKNNVGLIIMRDLIIAVQQVCQIAGRAACSAVEIPFVVNVMLFGGF